MENERNIVKEALDIFEKNWNKQIILYGPPGTSKTYSAFKIAYKFLNRDDTSGQCKFKDIQEWLNKSERFKMVQFHPSYTYEDFVRGISVQSGSNMLTYQVESKILEKFCLKNKCSKSCVLLIDEINRAPLASVLGELIYGLEYRNSEIETAYPIKNTPLKIPENLYIIGTMNTADRSIGSIDYAVRRRFAFISVPALKGEEATSLIKETWKSPNVQEKACEMYKKVYNYFDNNMEDSDIEKDDIRIGHTYFLGKQEIGDEGTSIAEEAEGAKKAEEAEGAEYKYLRYRINYQVKPILSEYVKDGLIKRDILDNDDLDI